MLKKFINEDRGSTLITVIVVIGFVTILTTIILGSSVTNLRMKAIDRRAKDDFYYTERALNDIYTGVGQDIAVIAADAYDSAFSRVGVGLKFNGVDDEGNPEVIDVNTSQAAEKYYRQKFFEDVVAWASTKANPATFQKYITDMSADNKKSYVKGNTDYTVLVEDNAETPVTETSKYVTDAVCVRIKDVGVITADESNDYKGEITTDIVISIPMMGFFDNNVDVTDYSIIANKGIDIDGNVTFTDGNVYAGMRKVGDEGEGGLSISGGDVDFEGSYLVSKGDITVGSSINNASLTVGKTRATRPNIWCDSIVLGEDALTPWVDINANTFALNDLELNALGSKAKFAGTYYGYDEGFFAHTNPDDPSPAATFDMLIGKGKEHSDSSAIIINGDQSTLDMKDLSTLMLMGKAYIEPTDGTNTYEISTAEALALRTNQQLYLVPPDFLACANPAAGAKSESDFGCNINTDWFGYRYLLKESDGTTPKIETIKIGTGDTAVSYAFLKFDDTRKDFSVGGKNNLSARTAFIYEIMLANRNGSDDTGCQPTQSQLKIRLSNSLANYDSFQLQECVVNNASDANIYSVNAIVNYVVNDGVTDLYNGGATKIAVPEITAVSNTAAMDRYLGYPQNLFRRFQWLCTMLINNEDIPLSHEVGPVSTGARGLRQIDETSAWMANSNYPYKYYVNPVGASYTYVADPTKIPASSYGTFVYTTDANYSVTGSFKGVVISTGDITVGMNAKIDGTLIAQGKIKFLGNNEVKSDRALIQKRISKEMELEREDGKQCSDYLISYLDSGTGNLLYGGISADGLSRKTTEERTDYTEYVFFENWKKGGRP